MATYIAGVTDYIPQVQPFKPDFNWYQDVMQRKQQKFDIGWNKVNTMYNSLLNAPMTRADNQEARDKFFTDAQMEIERLGSIDLSLEQNVASAYEVFKPFYEDDYMVNDMSWTRSYNDAKMKANSFKNCTDPEKCGGRYWDGGVQYLEYQRKNFMDSSAEDALNFARPEYIADPDIQGLATKYFDESKLSITQDIDTGQWIVRQENGKPLIIPLANYLAGRLGSDQKVLDYYKVKSFLLRQSDPEKAQKIYDERTSQTELTAEERASGVKAEEKKQNDTVAKQNFRNSADYLKAKAGSEKARLKYLSKRRAHLAEKYGKKGLDMSTLPQDVQDEFEALDDAILTQNGIAKYFADGANLARSVEKIEGDATIQMDNVVANALLNQDIMTAATTLAYRDFKQTQKANPYAVAKYNNDLAVDKEARKAAMDFVKLKFEARQDVMDKRFDLIKDIITGDNKNLINRLFGQSLFGTSGPGGGKSQNNALEKFLDAMAPMPDDAMYDSYIQTQMTLFPQAAPYYYSLTGGAAYNASQGYKPPPAKGGGKKGKSMQWQSTAPASASGVDYYKMTPETLPETYKKEFKKLGISDEEGIELLRKSQGAIDTFKEISKLSDQLPSGDQSKSPTIISGEKLMEVAGDLYDQGSMTKSTTLASTASITDMLSTSFDQLGGDFGEMLRKVNTPEAKALMADYDAYGMSTNRMLQHTDLFINTANAQLRRFIEADVNNGDRVAYETANAVLGGLFNVASEFAEGYGESSDRRREIEEAQFALVDMGFDIQKALKELPENQTLISARGMKALQSWPTYNDDNWHIWFNDNKAALLDNNNLIKLLGGSSVNDNSPIGGASRRFLNNYASKNKNFVYDDNLTSINAQPLVEESGKPGEKGYSFITSDGEKIEVISEAKYLALTQRDQESRWIKTDPKFVAQPLTDKEKADVARYEAVSKNGYTTPRITNEKLREISSLNPLFNGANGFSVEQAMQYANTVHDNKMELEKRINDNLINAYNKAVELKGYNSITPQTYDDEVNTQDIAIAAVIENLGRVDENGKFIKNTNSQILNGVFADILSPEGMAKFPDLFDDGFWEKDQRNFPIDFGDIATMYTSTFSQIENDNGFQFNNDNLMKFIFGTPEFTELSQHHRGTIIKGGTFWSMKQDPMFDQLVEFSKAITTGRPPIVEEWGEQRENFHANIRAAYNAGEIDVSREGENLILKSNKFENVAPLSLPLDEIETHASFEEVNEEIRDGIGEAHGLGRDSNPFFIFTDAYFAQPSPYSAVDGIGSTSVPATIFTPSTELDFTSEVGTYIKEELQELIDIGGTEKLSDGTYKVDLINGKGDDGADLSVTTGDGLEVIKGILDLHSEGVEEGDRNMNFKVTVQPMSLNNQDLLAGRFNSKLITVSGLVNYFKDTGLKNPELTALVQKLGYNLKEGTGVNATYTKNPFPDQITFKVYDSQTRTSLAALDKDPYLMSLSMGKPVVVNAFNETAGSVSLEPVINKSDMSESTVNFNSNMKVFDVEKGIYVDDVDANAAINGLMMNSFGIMDGNLPLSSIDNEVITTIYDVLKKQRVKNMILRVASPQIRMAQKDNNIELLQELQDQVINALENL